MNYLSNYAFGLLFACLFEIYLYHVSRKMRLRRRTFQPYHIVPSSLPQCQSHFAYVSRDSLTFESFVTSIIRLVIFHPLIFYPASRCLPPKSKFQTAASVEIHRHRMASLLDLRARQLIQGREHPTNKSHLGLRQTQHKYELSLKKTLLRYFLKRPRKSHQTRGRASSWQSLKETSQIRISR